MIISRTFIAATSTVDAGKKAPPVSPLSPSTSSDVDAGNQALFAVGLAEEGDEDRVEEHFAVERDEASVASIAGSGCITNTEVYSGQKAKIRIIVQRQLRVIIRLPGKDQSGFHYQMPLQKGTMKAKTKPHLWQLR